MNNLTKALVYESQGLKKDAILIYKEILENDPQNQEALLGIKRVSSGDVINNSDNNDMLELFYSTDKDDIDKFKRWLVDI